MSTNRLDSALKHELSILKEEGRTKSPERIIEQYIPPSGEWGPRYKLIDNDTPFIRLNSNSYLSLSNHPDLIKAADQATVKFGVGPGAVRFIDGTFVPHVQLEKKVGDFMGKPAAKIFNSAYTANCGLALSISNKKTFWITDQLNHNSIIRAMRISNISKENKAIFKHNDMVNLEYCLTQVPSHMERVIVIFDGIFSMRGDSAPINKINAICQKFDANFKDGVITVVDDSHGIGAYGDTGRGTCDYCKTSADIIIGTFGKAFGVNGGFVATSSTIIESVRQKADTYIYTNPLSVADCAAAIKAIEICDSDKGIKLLKHIQKRTTQLRQGLFKLNLESIPGPHPIVPLMVRNTPQTHKLVKYLFYHGVLVVGLTFPVVPKGDETIRFQINASHTSADIEYVIELLSNFK